MATFPALRPATRSFTAASYPNATHVAYSGRENRVRTSNAMTGARLRLQFLAISETQLLQIASHYAGQRGRFLPFPLSTEVLSGMTDPSILSPAGYQWIYVGVPQVTDISVGTAAAPSCVHDVELELEMVPEISTFTGGAAWVASAVLAGGAASDGETRVPGASWSAAVAIAGGAATVISASDSYFSSVSLLLHMDGSNGSTTFTDSSSAARTVTAAGNAQISTAQSKFGGASGLFDGSGDYLTVGDAAAMEPGSSDLTWEMWIKTTASNRYATLYSRTPNPFDSGMYSLMINQSSATSGNVALYVADYSGGSPLLATTDVSVRDDSWHHIAVVRNGSSWAIYVDGTSRATATWSGTIADIAYGPYIGRDQYYSGIEARDFPGCIDELRITKGVARYTSDFTPSAYAFPDS